MLDSQIVAAIVAGDPDGLAAAYDRYAAPLYAFCHSLLDDQADAADVVQDTFIIASAKLDGLADPDLLKSWLFAVARNECHRRLRARPGAVVGVETGEVIDDTIDFGIDLERAQLTEVVGAAMAALPLAKREVIELSLRQDFDSDDLASTLGISHASGEGARLARPRAVREVGRGAARRPLGGAPVLRRAGRAARRSRRQADRRRMPADRPACSSLPHLLQAHAPRPAARDAAQRAAGDRDRPGATTAGAQRGGVRCP